VEPSLADQSSRHAIDGTATSYPTPTFLDAFAEGDWNTSERRVASVAL
jgi:hypothetical protein